jgi:dephospho-CoA kinase
MRGKIVVIVVGLPGSGKSTAAQILKSMDFKVIELGDIWRELLKKSAVARNDPVATREFTRQLREREGKDVYARYAYRSIRRSREMVAIMGVRSTYEMDYFKKRMPQLRIIALLAPFSVRFERVMARSKPEDHRTLKWFKWQEQREKQGFMDKKSEEKHGVMRVIDNADYAIANVSTVARFRHDMRKVVSAIKARNS